MAFSVDTQDIITSPELRRGAGFEAAGMQQFAVPVLSFQPVFVKRCRRNFFRSPSVLIGDECGFLQYFWNDPWPSLHGSTLGGRLGRSHLPPCSLLLLGAIGNVDCTHQERGQQPRQALEAAASFKQWNFNDPPLKRCRGGRTADLWVDFRRESSKCYLEILTCRNNSVHTGFSVMFLM